MAFISIIHSGAFTPHLPLSPSGEANVKDRWEFDACNVVGYGTWQSAGIGDVRSQSSLRLLTSIEPSLCSPHAENSGLPASWEILSHGGTGYGSQNIDISKRRGR